MVCLVEGGGEVIWFALLIGIGIGFQLALFVFKADIRAKEKKADK